MPVIERCEVISQADPFRGYVANFSNLIELARKEALESGVSYREFFVGASAYVQTGDEAFLVAAANHKPSPDVQKLCAEARMLELLRGMDIGFLSLPGIVVVGTTDQKEIEEVSGLPTPTLHPCSTCRDELLRNDPNVSDEMIIATAGIRENIFEAYLWKDMRHRYDTKENRKKAYGAPSPSTVSQQYRVSLYDDLVEIAETRASNMGSISRRRHAELARRALLHSAQICL